MGAENKGRGRSNLALAVLVVVVAVGLAISGAAFVSARSEAFGYACLTATQSGADISVTTTGLIHYGSGGYFVSCAEGGSAPTSPASFGCLRITPQTSSPSYPGASVAIDYYLSASGGSVAISGAPANATELTQPNSAVLQVSCG